MPYRWDIWIEGGILLAIAPFLLFPTFFIEATIVALFLVIAIWLWPILVKSRPLLPVTPFNIVLFFWGLSLIIGIVVTADPDLTLPKATGLILGLTTWRYLVWLAQDRQWLGWGIIGFVLLGFGFILLGVLSVNWSAKVPLLANIVNQLPPRLIGLAGSPQTGTHANEFAGTMLVHFPLLISLLIDWRPERLGKVPLPKVAFVTLLLLTLLIAGLLALTQSRSGWLGGLGGFCLLLLFWGFILPPSNKRRSVWLGLAILLTVIAGALVLIGPERLETLWEEPPQATAIGALTTVNFRKEVWQWALTGIEDFPFTGSGLGSFRRVVLRLYPISIPSTYDIAHAHNIFFQVALDVGLPGLIAYLALLMLAGTVGWQVARQDEELRPFTLGLLAGLAGLHIYGLTDALAPGSKPGLIFWATLGLLAAMRRVQQAEIHPS